MEDSILKKSENSKGINKYFTGKYKFISYILLASIVAGPFAYGFFSGEKSATDVLQEIQEFTAKKTDLQISISSDGRVVNNENVNLVFSVTGTINNIYVQDGQIVKKGDKIASLDTTELEFGLSNAKTAKQIAISNLLAKQAGATDIDIELSEKNIDLAESHLIDTKKQNELDIKNAELSLKTAELNLQAVKKETESSILVSGFDIEEIELKIDQAYSDAIVKSALALTEIDNAINEADRVLGINDTSANEAIEDVLGVKNITSVSEAKSAFNNVAKARDEYIINYQEIKASSNHTKILEKLDSTTALVKLASQMMHKTSEVLENTITNTGFSQTNLDSYKDSILTEHGKIKQEIEDLINAKQAIESAELEKKTKESSSLSIDAASEAKIAAAEQQYESAKLQLENIKIKAVVNENDALNQLDIAKSQFSLKTEPIRDVDIASLRSQITQAQNQIDEAEYKLSMATLVAPIDGKISNIAFQVGELISDKSDVLATITNKGNFSVETYIEEIDITKIKINQKTYITFDAIEGVKLEGEVNIISDVPTIDANGIVTYLVKLTLTDTKDAPIKEGMTSYIDFIIAEAKNVIAIPVEAIKRVDGKPSVQLDNGEWKAVQSGFTDGKMVEISSGINPGDKIRYYE